VLPAEHAVTDDENDEESDNGVIDLTGDDQPISASTRRSLAMVSCGLLAAAGLNLF